MQMKVQFNQSNIRLDAKFADFQTVTVHKDADPYTGEYVITPRIDAQTVPTAQKFMAEDMTIKAIPYFDVSNISGGSTVYIGKEIET